MSMATFTAWNLTTGSAEEHREFTDYARLVIPSEARDLQFCGEHADPSLRYLDDMTKL